MGKIWNGMRLLNVDGIITDYPDDMVGEADSVNELIDEVVDENLQDIGDIPDSKFEDGEY